MKICFAVEKDEGVNSPVYGHFGSAPFFLIYDTENQAMEDIRNGDSGHAHGACNPLAAIGGKAVDAVVVGGIGAGALNRLNASGIRVFRAMALTVKDNLGLMSQNRLPELLMNGVCGGHGGGCGHH